MRLSSRERTLVLIGAVALAAFVILFAVALPMRGRAMRLANDASALRRQIEKADEMQKQEPEMKRQIGALRADAESVTRSGADITPDIVRDIEKLSGRLGVRLLRVRPEEPEPTGGCVRYPATFEVESTFDQAVQLLYELEQPAERLWVEGAELSTARGAAGKLRTIVHVAAYTLTPETEGDDGET